MTNSPPLPSLLIIPSGIGCEVGGYAGDAIPFARLLASASGSLITHPNVMNGASLYWNDERIQYVEGFSIDQFACGEIYLRPVRKQRVGVLIDAGLEASLFNRHLNVIDACRATLGLDIGPVVKTESPLQISLKTASSGSSWGELSSPEILFKAAERLKKDGATAIAIVTRFPDHLEKETIDAYRQGKGVDQMAGAEAVISHLLVRQLGLPCAHAPALSPLGIEDNLDPRAAAEEIGHTFLACVLVGLSRAPELISKENLLAAQIANQGDLIGAQHLGAVVAPEGALGGAAVLACIERRVPLIVVSNPGVLKVGLGSLGITDRLDSAVEVFTASNYLEAASILLGLREGISISSLQRPIKSVNRVQV